MTALLLAPRTGGNVLLPLAVPDFVLSPLSAQVLRMPTQDDYGRRVRGEDVAAYLAMVAARDDARVGDWFTVDYESLARLCWGPEIRPSHWQSKLNGLLASMGCYPEPRKGCSDNCGLRGSGTWHMHVTVCLPALLTPLLPLQGPVGAARPDSVPLYAPLLLLGRSAGLGDNTARALLDVLSEGAFDDNGEPRPLGRRRRFRFDGSRPLKGGYPLGHRLVRAGMVRPGFCDQKTTFEMAVAYLNIAVAVEHGLGLNCVVTIRERRRSADQALDLLLKRKLLAAQEIASWKVSFSASDDFFRSLRSALQASAGVTLLKDYSPYDEADRNEESPSRRRKPAGPGPDQPALLDRLKRLMQEQGLTQGFVAGRLGTSQKTVWSFLQGGHKLRLGRAKVLQRWLAAEGV
jgi:hypothetical protein